MKKRSRKEKFAIIAVSTIIGLCAGFVAYSHFNSDMTDWQKSQKIDFSANTGATKFKALVDALSVGGAAFCASSIAILLAIKLRKGK